MTSLTPRLLAVAVTSLTLAACSGGSSPTTSAAPSTVASPSNLAPQGTGRVALSFRESTPSNTPSRTRKFLSFAAQSVTIVVDGGTPTTLNFPAPCSANNLGTQAVCPALGFTAPTGSHKFQVTAYDAANGSGSTLGTGTITATVMANATTPMNISLFGIPVTGALRLDSATVSGSQFVTLTSTAYDADGYTILGQYANPITVTKSNDPNNVTTLNKTTLISSSDQISVEYNGTKFSGAIVFTPSAPGDNANPVSLTNVPPVQPMLVTLNEDSTVGGEAIDVYNPSGTGVQNPLFATTGTNGGGGQVAFAPNGDIFYTGGNQLKIFQNNQATSKPVAVLNLPEQPTALLSGSYLLTTLSDTTPFGTLNDATSTTSFVLQLSSVQTQNGNIANNAYQTFTDIPVASETYPYPNNGPSNNFVLASYRGSIVVPGSDGIDTITDGTVTSQISYGNTLKGVTDMAFDQQKGTLWVCDSTTGDVVGIPQNSTTADGSPAITGTYVKGCSHVRVDSTGSVYVETTQHLSTTINVFPSTATGNAVPTRVLTLGGTAGSFELLNI